MPDARPSLLRHAALAAAISGYGVYAVVLAYFEFGVSCRASGEGFLPTLFVGAPIIGVAATGVWLLRATVPMNGLYRWIVYASLGLAALVTVPQLLVSSVLGHHPCGPRYDQFLAFVEAWDRWVPVGNLLLIGIAATVALGPYVRKIATAETEATSPEAADEAALNPSSAT